MLIQITGSRVHRHWKCPPSSILPQIITIDEDNPPAERGKAVHAFLETVRDIGREAALNNAPPELRVFLELLNLDELPTNLATEVAFLYDWKLRTAREIGRGIGRDYDGHLRRTGQAPRGPNEIPCTLDLIGVESRTSEILGYVGDYKTGHTKYPAPDRFGQTMLGALCVRAVYKADRVVVELLYVRGDGTSAGARRTVDDWDMDTFADEIEAAFVLAQHAEEEYAAGRGLPVREGPHCDHCPAYKNCPAKIAMVRALPAELAWLGITPELIAGEGYNPLGNLSPEGAAEIWMTIERISELFGYMKDEICGLAVHEEIPLPDGRVIGRLVTRREGLDGKIAAALIEQWFGVAARDKAIDVKVSKDSLREAVVDHVNERKAAGEKLVIQSKKGDGVFDRALAELRRRGGVEESVTDSVKPHVPRKRLKS